MQTLEQVICSVPQVKEARLLPAAEIAYNKPDNGITIINPTAAKVIKDCAFVTTQYLPFYVLSKLGNPFSFYQKKVDIEQIKDFYNRSLTNPITHQLLTFLVERAKTQFNITNDSFYDKTDPYNDFDQKSAEIQKMHNTIFVLSKAFGVI